MNRKNNIANIKAKDENNLIENIFSGMQTA